MIDRYARPEMKRIWSEESKYDAWLRVELAVCEAWAEAGVIPAEDMTKLRAARYDIVRLEEVFERTHHDMTAFTRSVTAGLGPEGRWIHLGLTSNDVIDTAQNLLLKESGKHLYAGLANLEQVLRERAIEFKDTLMMGRTHGIHAEPITFGLKLALWREEVRRGQQRLAQACREIAIGKISGAVGTYATVSPDLEQKVCSQLELQPAPISNQIIQRDRHASFITTLAIIAASLEKFATELRHLQRTEVRETEEPFAEGQTGSSAMPHKRNPELSERICGLARLMRGHAVTALENVALWHERDISHSSAERIILPDACMGLDYILDLFTNVMRALRVYPERMWDNIESSKGLIFSQRVLLALIEKGASREEAYELVQRHALFAWDNDADFRDLLRQESAITAYLSIDDLEKLFDYSYYIRFVDETFKRLDLL